MVRHLKFLKDFSGNIQVNNSLLLNSRADLKKVKENKPVRFRLFKNTKCTTDCMSLSLVEDS